MASLKEKKRFRTVQSFEKFTAALGSKLFERTSSKDNRKRR